MPIYIIKVPSRFLKGDISVMGRSFDTTDMQWARKEAAKYAGELERSKENISTRIDDKAFINFRYVRILANSEKLALQEARGNPLIRNLRNSNDPIHLPED